MTDWRPASGPDAAAGRAAILQRVRDYFRQSGALEVDTPALSPFTVSDTRIESFEVSSSRVSSRPLYLQTSPEFAMKRLLAAGSGPIYQICKAFRDGEAGRLHNPEFSILEWYRPGWGLPALIDEVATIARLALAQPALAVHQHDYAALFATHLDIDIFDSSAERLQALAMQHTILGAEQMELDRDGWLDLLFSHLIQPQLGSDRLCFVNNYPASQAALARLNADGLTAARFELFHRGVELANGFHELTDADEQAARFEADNCARRSSGLPPVRIDRRLLGAMQHGLSSSCWLQRSSAPG